MRAKWQVIGKLAKYILLRFCIKALSVWKPLDLAVASSYFIPSQEDKV